MLFYFLWVNNLKWFIEMAYGSIQLFYFCDSANEKSAGKNALKHSTMYKHVQKESKYDQNAIQTKKK